jgi:hypothetical protein
MVVVPRRRGCREISQRFPPCRDARMNRRERRHHGNRGYPQKS